MNPMNMAGMNAGNPAMGGGMPMMNNGANGVQIRQPEEQEETNYESRLNTYIYGYFLKKGQWDLARALKNSGQQFEPEIVHPEGAMNGANDQNDTKDGIDKRPDDLPDIGGDDQSGTFLLSWFCPLLGHLLGTEEEQSGDIHCEGFRCYVTGMLLLSIWAVNSNISTATTKTA